MEKATYGMLIHEAVVRVCCCVVGVLIAGRLGVRFHGEKGGPVALDWLFIVCAPYAAKWLV